ncbi:MAG: 3-dehydroquinate synthase [Phycisphaera sp.]|nr:3-dehydroquinate synthase [Phycisphaera sp.]
MTPPTHREITQPFEVRFTHRVIFTRHALSADNPVLAGVMPGDPPGKPTKVLAFIDSRLLEQSPGLLLQVDRYVQAHAGSLTLAGPTDTVEGGEASKNNPRLLEPVLRAIADAGLCRKSYVLVIGGGAVLDAVGLAAAIAHRGIRLIRLPSTTLAMADSGVGVKNGINAFGKKNYLGTFAPPWAVVNDFGLLDTLSDRDFRCGFVEAVKVALLKDPAFFEYLEAHAEALNKREPSATEHTLARSAELHLQHITTTGDPYEMTAARPLDFGHWAAHELETITNYDLRHGEAVAVGLAIDTLYAAQVGLLDVQTTHRIHRLLRTLGFTLTHPALKDTDRLLKGIESFREHLGGELTITMLQTIGRPVDVHAIDTAQMQIAIEKLRAGEPAA